ncbi:hypothetical protein ACQPYK_16345 [Streptosporangium sp. CA-135522]|uniref:hypothetical protein n=1 Tax=Streptosporangium sp. CA-135522 TaxID=3240072 RepID=UPI003D8F7EE4
MVAKLLGVEEAYLWPNALTPTQTVAISETEMVTVYPHRWVVPKDAWGRLFSAAQEKIDILVYSGIFIAQDVGIVRIFTDRADAGVKVRIRHYLAGTADGPYIG